jgi:hypothetical protein
MGDSGVTQEPKRQDRDAPRDEQKDTHWGKVVEFFSNHPTLVLTLLYLYVTAVGLIYSAALYSKFGINIFDYTEIADFLLAAFKNPVAFLAAGILVAMGVALAAYEAIKIRIKNRRELALIRDFESRVDVRKDLDESHPDKSQEIPTSLDEALRSQEIPTSLATSLDEARRALDEAGRSAERRVEMIFAVAFIIALTGIFTPLVLPYYSAGKTASSITNGEHPSVDVRYRSFSGSAGQVTEPNLTLIGATQKAVFFYDVDEKHTIVIPQAQIVSIEVPEEDS